MNYPFKVRWCFFCSFSTQKRLLHLSTNIVPWWYSLSRLVYFKCITFRLYYITEWKMLLLGPGNKCPSFICSVKGRSSRFCCRLRQSEEGLTVSQWPGLGYTAPLLVKVTRLFSVAITLSLSLKRCCDVALMLFVLLIAEEFYLDLGSLHNNIDSSVHVSCLV